MPSAEIILCEEDVITIKEALGANGLYVIFNERRNVPSIRLESPNAVIGRERVSLYALRKDWVFGDYCVRSLTNKATGKVYYDLSPRVNFSAISLSFYLPKPEDRESKLGFGDIDVYPTWLKSPENELCKAPSDASRVYRGILGLIKKGGTVLQTLHGRKIIMRHALAKFLNGSHRIPHPWLEELAEQTLKPPPLN